MLLASSQTTLVEKKGRWLHVNDKRWGFMFVSDEREPYVIRHCRKIGTLKKEKGFYVPHSLIKLPILFEVKVPNGTYAHYIYRPNQAQRFIKSGEDVFISMAALEFHADSAHIQKPKEAK